MKITIATMLFFAAVWVQPPKDPPRKMPEVVAIFAINGDSQALSIDPVVKVYYGNDQKYKTIPSLNDPVPSAAAPEDFDKFEHSFYKPGSPLSVFRGGEKIGIASVRSSDIQGRDGGCIDLSAIISYKGTEKPLLASNTGSEISGHVSTRRAATPAEISILRQLVVEWLIDYGLDQQLVPRGSFKAVTSTVLRESAGRAFIGCFEVVSKKAIHRLFAVAERNQGRYQLTLADLEVQHDLEDGVDKSERQYIDQLDINNDGIDEMITSATHYESWGYTVWALSSKENVWYKAHEGLGGGC